MSLGEKCTVGGGERNCCAVLLLEEKADWMILSNAQFNWMSAT